MHKPSQSPTHRQRRIRRPGTGRAHAAGREREEARAAASSGKGRPCGR